MYIQHPIPIPAPGDKDKIELKPMMLTKREQKKMRKLRRKGELQDKRDRIRMGLLPPEPPKGGLIFLLLFPLTGLMVSLCLQSDWRT